MTKLTGFVAAAFFIASPAFAADIAVKAMPPSSAPIANWTGLYVDGGGGYGMWTADTMTFNPVTGTCVLCVAQRQGGRGWFGTVGGGYDYQFAWANWGFVIGALGNFDFASIKGTIQDQVPIFAGEEKMTSAWAAGGRLGWLATPSVLTYVNGGWSGAHFDGTDMVSTFTGAPTGFVTPSFSRTGWFIGSGVEYMFAPGWFGRAEYRYADYGTVILPDVNPRTGGVEANISFHPIVQTVRTELVYKFNWFR